jgi:cbb3-type cytochrome oxidase subunit 3
MGIGDSMFTIIFVMMGAATIVSGLNFEKKYGNKFKGENKEEYIKLNKIVLISMGGIILFGTLLGQGIPLFKDIITNITMVILLIIWFFYTRTSKKRFSNKK